MGAKELFEIFDYYIDTFVNILVDEDQEVSEPWDSRFKYDFNSFGLLLIVDFSGPSFKVPQKKSQISISELQLGLKQLWKRSLTF